MATNGDTVAMVMLADLFEDPEVNLNPGNRLRKAIEAYYGDTGKYADPVADIAASTPDQLVKKIGKTLNSLSAGGLIGVAKRLIAESKTADDTEEEAPDVPGKGKKASASSNPSGSTASPVFNPTIIVRSGRPEDMSLKELLDALISGERTLDYQNAIRRYSRNRRVFVRKSGSDILDVEGTLELIQFADAGDEDIPDFWGDDEVPTETLEEILNQTFFANPLTGRRLPKGDKWLKIPVPRRVLAAYGRIAGLIKGTEDEFALVSELQQSELTARWKPIQQKFDKAEKNGDPQVLQAQAAIRWFPRNKGGAASAGSGFRPEESRRTTF